MTLSYTSLKDGWDRSIVSDGTLGGARVIGAARTSALWDESEMRWKFACWPDLL